MVAEKLHKHIITTDMANYWWDDESPKKKHTKISQTSLYPWVHSNAVRWALYGPV